MVSWGSDKGLIEKAVCIPDQMTLKFPSSFNSHQSGQLPLIIIHRISFSSKIDKINGLPDSAPPPQNLSTEAVWVSISILCLSVRLSFPRFRLHSSPFECFLLIRSLKTLSIRMERHKQNGLRVAQFLASHPAVERTIHPGTSPVRRRGNYCQSSEETHVR